MNYVTDAMTAIGFLCTGCCVLVLIVFALASRRHRFGVFYGIGDGEADEPWHDIRTFLPDCARDFDDNEKRQL